MKLNWIYPQELDIISKNVFHEHNLQMNNWLWYLREWLLKTKQVKCPIESKKQNISSRDEGVFLSNNTLQLKASWRKLGLNLWVERLKIAIRHQQPAESLQSNSECRQFTQFIFYYWWTFESSSMIGVKQRRNETNEKSFGVGFFYSVIRCDTCITLPLILQISC